MKDIYQGRNFIFESMAESMMEDKSKGKDKKAANKTSDELIAVSLNQVFTILLNSKMENAKTVRGFQEIKNKILGTSNFGAFRQYLVTLLQSLAAMDSQQKEAYDNNINFIIDVLSKAENQLGDTKIFDTVKKGIISKLLTNFEADLQEREKQMRKTNPKIYAEAVKKGQILKEDTRTGDETSVEDAEFRGAVFNKSKESLDAATAFVGMIERDQLVDVLKGKPELTKYKEIAANLYKEAQDLQLLDREGIAKVVTAIGTFRRNEYARKQDSLINEIIREKREYVRLKDTIQKSTGTSTIIPAIPDPVCPPGMIWDRAKSQCVSSAKPNKETGGGGKKKIKPTPVVVKDCQFPIRVGSKCNQVGELQNKIIELVPSAKAYLNLKGGSDKVYGKATSLVTNILWGYISNNKNVEMSSDLTQEKFDAVMKLTTNDVDLDLSGATPVRDGLENTFKNKLEENENSFNTPILSFDKFSEILESNLDEGVWKDGKIYKTGDQPYPATKKIIKDSCVKKSIESGKVEDCFGTKPVPVKDDEKEKEKEDEFPTRDKWKGLKYVETQDYPVSFDESLLSFWVKEAAMLATGGLAKGGNVLLKAGSTALRALAIKGAIRIGAKKLASRLSKKLISKIGNRMAAKAALGSSKTLPVILNKLTAATSPKDIANLYSRFSRTFFNTYKKIPIRQRLAGGAIGGTLGAAALDFLAGRDSYRIQIIEGYIDRTVILATARGLINTIDGYVSDDDFACISNVLAVVKGAWTTGADGRPASAWAVLKKAYQAVDGESLVDDINSISPKMGEVEGFPKLISINPLGQLSEMDWDFAVMEVKSFVQKLENNESKLRQNLSKIPQDYVDAFVNGEFAEYNDQGDFKDLDLDSVPDAPGANPKTNDSKDKKSSGGNITI